jgi:hypothetical protein
MEKLREKIVLLTGYFELLPELKYLRHVTNLIIFSLIMFLCRIK